MWNHFSRGYKVFQKIFNELSCVMIRLKVKIRKRLDDFIQHVWEENMPDVCGRD